MTRKDEMTDANEKRCHDCGVKPGELHQSGCDVERCAACGGQAISCGCESSEYEKLDRLPWTGEWPGEAECREFGWWSLWDQVKGWVRCSAGTPNATPDLNRLATEGRWDVKARRFVRVSLAAAGGSKEQK